MRMFFFGVLGYPFKKLDYPLAPLVFALVLENPVKNALRRSLIMSQVAMPIFFTHHIGATFMLIVALFFGRPGLLLLTERRQEGVPGPAVPTANRRRPPYPSWQ